MNGLEMLRSSPIGALHFSINVGVFGADPDEAMERAQVVAQVASVMSIFIGMRAGMRGAGARGPSVRMRRPPPRGPRTPRPIPRTRQPVPLHRFRIRELVRRGLASRVPTGQLFSDSRLPQMRRLPDGSISIISRLGPPQRRQGLEHSLPPSVQVGLEGWHRAHAQSPGLGHESRHGIVYAPPEVNLVLQARVESFLRETYARRAPGVEFYLTTVTRTHPGDPRNRLAEIEYELQAERGGRRTRVWSVSLTVQDQRDNPRVSITDPAVHADLSSFRR
jgi:hypothetical protein